MTVSMNIPGFPSFKAWAEKAVSAITGQGGNSPVAKTTKRHQVARRQVTTAAAQPRPTNRRQQSQELQQIDDELGPVIAEMERARNPHKTQGNLQATDRLDLPTDEEIDAYGVDDDPNQGTQIIDIDSLLREVDSGLINQGPVS